MDQLFLVLMQRLLDRSDGIGWRRLGGIILIGLLAVYLAQEGLYHHGGMVLEALVCDGVSGKKSRRREDDRKESQEKRGRQR